MAHRRTIGGIIVLLVLAASCVWLAPGLSKRFATAPAQTAPATSASASDNISQSAQSKPPIPIVSANQNAAAYRWGGALNSAAFDGAHFFDHDATQRFLSTVEP